MTDDETLDRRERQAKRELDERELEAEKAVELPEREEMSLIDPSPIGPPVVSIE
jgi:hypothetical protein